MNNLESLKALAKLAITSDYLLQVVIDNTGKILSSDSGIGPVPSLFDKKEKQIYFGDCFDSSQWSKYESQRLKACKSSRQSFLLDLQKINHPEGTITATRWEFYFISEDFGTCLGIGHPLEKFQPYNIGIGDFFESISGKQEMIDNILEEKLLGFWEFDLSDHRDKIIHSLAQILGHNIDELEDSKELFWEFPVHTDDFANIAKQLNNHFKVTGDLPFRKEFRLVTKANQTIWVVAFGKTLKWSPDGIPQKVLGCIINISDRKRQETWMKEHHYFLKDLAFNQSHSLRARVANILGIVELLNSEAHSEEVDNLFKIIENEAKMLDKDLKKSIKQSMEKRKSIEEDLFFHNSTEFE